MTAAAVAPAVISGIGSVMAARAGRQKTSSVNYENKWYELPSGAKVLVPTVTGSTDSSSSISPWEGLSAAANTYATTLDDDAVSKKAVDGTSNYKTKSFTPQLGSGNSGSYFEDLVNGTTMPTSLTYKR